MNPSQSIDSGTEVAVRVALLRMALHNSARSVPVQFAAVAWIVYLGWRGGHDVVTAIVAAMGLAVGLWRLLITRRYAPGGVVAEDMFDRASTQCHRLRLQVQAALHCIKH